MIDRESWNRTSPLLGAHMSIAGGYHRAVEAAERVGFSTVQIFTKNNNQWNARPITVSEARSFREALERTGVSRPIGHSSYLINLASPDAALRMRSIDALTIELERAEALGLVDLVHHPGAHVGSGEEAGIAGIVEGLDAVHRRTTGISVRIALETTAGQGTHLGHRFEHLAQILGGCEEPGRLGICLDTCHLFAAGYPLETPEGYNQMIGELDRVVGLDRVRVWHLNDSVKPRGSRVDRHARIGHGCLGVEAFRPVVNDPRFLGLPMILETPKGEEAGVELDLLNLQALLQLIDGGRAARP